MKNCKNCGAPLTGKKCDYCGTKSEMTFNLNEFLIEIEEDSIMDVSILEGHHLIVNKSNPRVRIIPK